MTARAIAEVDNGVDNGERGPEPALVDNEHA
jgi:hypothetical protein